MSGALWPNGSKAIPRVTSEFGPRESFWTGSYWTMPFHYGIDLVGWLEIRAAMTGTIILAGYNGGAGYEVRLRADNGDVFRYFHNSRLLVSVGDRVIQGQVLAIMGTTGASTGVHCHFECKPGGGAAVDPRQYMAAANASTAGGGLTPTPPPVAHPKRKQHTMATGVIYTLGGSDEKRLGAIVDAESGFVSRFGWFSVSYANSLAKGFGLEAAGPVTPGQYGKILVDLAAHAAAQGKLFVDIDDDDVPQVKA